MPAKNFYIALYDARADLFITPYLVDEFGVPPPPYKPGKGLTAYVMRTEKPLLATPEVFEQLVQSGQVELIGRPAIDWLGAPLKTQHGTIGVMAVYTYTEAARLSEADKDVFVFVSTQVAMAVERKQAQEQIRKLNRTLQVINGANQALVRATEETELLQHICQIIVDVGGYRLAWVGLAEQDEAKTVRPVAAAGHDEGYLDTINITWADAERGRGPTGTAIRTGQPIIARNILTDPYFAPWREQAVRRGYASSIALPLLAGDRAIGALNIYATEPDAFDAEEIELLTEMAGDLAYGIVAVRTRAEHQRAEERIRRLNRDLERRARGLAALNRAGQIMASTLNLNILLERVMEQIKNLLDAEGASVLLRPSDAEKADSELVFAAVTGTAAEKLINRRVPITAGIAGWAMRERQSVLVADAQNDPRLDHSIDAITGLTTRSLLAMPLISKGSVLGVVEAINNVSGTFDQYDLEVLEALTSSAAIAIENARLFSMLNQEKRRLEFLYHLSQHLVESLDMGEVAQRALDGLRAVAGLLRGLVVVRESPSSAEISGGERDLLRMVAVSGYDAESVEALNQRLQLRVGDGLIGWVAANRQLAVIDNVTQDPRWMVVSGLDEWVRSALSVPLLSGDDLVGVLSIYSEREAFFTEDVRQLVESAAASVAIAIANARLFSTERERVTELARALEQQRELDRLQREFIQNVSHELRTPLALIRGHAEVLESSWLGELQPEQKESISVITRRAQMLGRLVDDIMSILEVERRELKQEPVDLAQLIRTSLADFQPAAQKASLTLSADIAPDLPAVSGDTIALRRALDNLVGNAFKFTPAGGRIAVHLSRSEEAVRLEVADTGIGIPSEHLGRIFERFYQVDGSMTRKYSGVGLGLALVKSIVEAHGGQITVTSQVGVGTTFTILLPNA
jgi:signal transduction histidine kinase